MKLLYATSVSYPSTRANRVQIRAMARAFAAHLGSSFVFGVRTVSGEDFSGVEVVEMEGMVRSPVLAFRYALLVKRRGVTHVFCREEKLMAWLSLYLKVMAPGVVCMLELHDLPEDAGGMFWKGIRSADVLFVLTSLLKEDLVTRGIEADRIVVLPDGVEERFLTFSMSKGEAREELGLVQEKKIIVYNGHLYPWKGADVLAEAAVGLPEDMLVCFVGGLPEMVAEFKEKYVSDRVEFFGYRPYEEIPTWLRAADVLVLPNSGEQTISARYTSPLKMLEFMAMGGNIVASDLPSLRELLSDDDAIFFAPDDAKSLKDALVKAVGDEGASERGVRVKKKAEDLTWFKRAGRVLGWNT